MPISRPVGWEVNRDDSIIQDTLTEIVRLVTGAGTEPVCTYNELMDAVDSYLDILLAQDKLARLMRAMRISVPSDFSPDKIKCRVGAELIKVLLDDRRVKLHRLGEAA